MPTSLNRWQLLLVFFLPIILLFGVFSTVMYQFYISQIFYLDEKFEDASFSINEIREDLGGYRENNQVNNIDNIEGVLSEDDWEHLSLQEIDKKLKIAGLEPIGDSSDPFYQFRPEEIDNVLGDRYKNMEDIFFIDEGDDDISFKNLPYISQSRFEETQRQIALDSFWRIIFLFSGLLIFVGGLSYILMRITLRPIEKNMKAQKEFIANASHELKTPLALMKTEAEVLLDSKHQTLEEYQQFAKNVVEDTDNLNTLSNTLLDFNVKKRIETKEISIQNTLQKLITKFQSRIEKEGKILLLDFPKEDFSLLFSPSDLQQIITIILDNACKYTKSGDTISIYRKGNTLCICNTGKGIDPKDLPFVFDRFYRSKEERNNNGHGLGLSLAREIIERNNGKITIENNNHHNNNSNRTGVSVRISFKK